VAFLTRVIIYPLYCIKRSWKPTQRTANVVRSHFLFLSQLLDTFQTHFCGTFSADCFFTGNGDSKGGPGWAMSLPDFWLHPLVFFLGW